MDEATPDQRPEAVLKAHLRTGFARRLAIVPEHDLIYVRNSKAATSTVMLWLHRLHTGDHDLVPLLRAESDAALPRPSQVEGGWGRVRRMLLGEAFTCTFVRHPIRRAASAYHNKIIARTDHPGRVQVQTALGLPEGPEHEVSIDQFVSALEQLEPAEMDSHWRPQHLNVLPEVVPYGLIGRVERFHEDLELIRELAGLPKVPMRPMNVRPSPEDPLTGRPDLVRRLEVVYARDFELFGY